MGLRDHKHAYERVIDTLPWWKMLFVTPKSRLVCKVCHRSIDEIIDELEALSDAAQERLAELIKRSGADIEALAKVTAVPPISWPRPPRCGDDTCVDEHG